MEIMGKFRIQRIFAVLLGLIVLGTSWVLPIEQPTVIIGCFMVFWGFDGLVNE